MAIILKIPIYPKLKSNGNFWMIEQSTKFQLSLLMIYSEKVVINNIIVREHYKLNQLGV